MGGGTWSSAVYDSSMTTARATLGDTMAYTASVRASGTPRDKWAVHKDLNPHGVKFRESRDSAEHPTSLAIVVLFDVTGSMGSIPRTLQEKLPQLLGMLVRKGYVAHPQIMFGGIGDATCDAVPLQVGQFESDNRMDDNLANILLEGGGGGQKTESYELAMYFMARHSSMDCWEKRQVKGYLFIIGDEMPYPAASRSQVQRLIGDGLEADISTRDIVRELTARYEVFYLLPKHASHGGDRQVLEAWRALLGQNVLELDDAAAVCETIALTIGEYEGAADAASGLADLVDVGADPRMAEIAVRATSHLSGREVVVVAEGGLPPVAGDDSTIRRL